MRRREFITLLGGAAAAWPVVARAQQAKVVTVGYLTPGSPEAIDSPGLTTFREGLRELGYVEGQNLVLEQRSAEGQIERLPVLAAELVRLHVDVIVAVATPAARAAQQTTRTIPIVGASMGDPVSDGLVESLARPGGNITGTTFLGPELVPKRLALLRELLPKASRVGAIWHPGAFSDRTSKVMMSDATAAAATLGLQLQYVAVRGPGDLDGAFAEMANDRAEALFTFPSPMLYGARQHIVGLAATHRLPAGYNSRDFVQAGGLMAYGSSLAALGRRTAIYVDKILKGAKPADLPVERTSHVRARDQSQDREGARAGGAAVSSAARRRGGRMRSMLAVVGTEPTEQCCNITTV